MRGVKQLVLVYDGSARDLARVLAGELAQIPGCTLCEITHVGRREHQDWRSCRRELGVRLACYHHDDLPTRYGDVVHGRVPCVLAEVDEEIIYLVDAPTIRRCYDGMGAYDLRAHIEQRAARESLALGAPAFG